MKKFLTIPRIIGALCIVIAVLAYFTGRLNFWAFLVGVIGIMLVSVKTKYSQECFDDFISSFKRWTTILVTALYDAIFFMLLKFSGDFYQWRVQVKTLQTQAGTVLTQNAFANPETLSQNVSSLHSFIIFLIVSVLLFLAFNFITYVVSRTIIWTTIAEKKPTRKFFLRFAGLNAIWWVIWLPIIFIMLISLQKSPVLKAGFVFILLIAAFFTLILDVLFVTGKGYSSIGHAFAIGISKLFRFAVPYGFAFIFAFVVMVIATLLFSLLNVQGKLTVAASMIISVPFLAWLRVYMYQTIKKLM